MEARMAYDRKRNKQTHSFYGWQRKPRGMTPEQGKIYDEKIKAFNEKTKNIVFEFLGKEYSFKEVTLGYAPLAQEEFANLKIGESLADIKRIK
jgi:hypothetical protein